MEYSIQPVHGFHRNVKLTLSTTDSIQPLLLALPANNHYFFDIYELARLDFSALSPCFKAKMYRIGALDVDLESASYSSTSKPHFIIMSLEPKESWLNQYRENQGQSACQDALSVPFHLRYHPPTWNISQTHSSFQLESPFVFYSCKHQCWRSYQSRRGDLSSLLQFFLPNFSLAESNINLEPELVSFINSFSRSQTDGGICGTTLDAIGSTTMQVPVSQASLQPKISFATYFVAISGVIYVFYHLYRKLATKETKPKKA